MSEEELENTESNEIDEAEDDDSEEEEVDCSEGAGNVSPQKEPPQISKAPTPVTEVAPVNSGDASGMPSWGWIVFAALLVGMFAFIVFFAETRVAWHVSTMEAKNNRAAEEAATALVEIGGREAFYALIDSAIKGPKFSRELAIRALGDFNHPETAEKLRIIRDMPGMDDELRLLVDEAILKQQELKEY